MGDLESVAIARIQEAARLSEFYYQKPLLLTYSGGKDSEVCLELCKRAGVPFEVMHNLTTADAPETVYHVRDVFHKLELEGIKCEIVLPAYKKRPTSMWALMPIMRQPPTPARRWCCRYLKEASAKKRCMVLGVRRAESRKRADSGVAELPGKIKGKKQVFDFDNNDERIIAPCQMKAKIKIHPIVDWEDRDVWEFLWDAKVEMNPCYAMGFTRVGCVGCPMAGKSRYQEFRQWPQYEKLYRMAFERMLEACKVKRVTVHWKSADDVFRWWMEDKNLDGQLDLWGREIGGEDGNET